MNLLTGCAALTPLKAGPAPDSGFLQHAEKLAAAKPGAPFQRIWQASDRVSAGSPIIQAIYIAPINTDHIKALTEVSDGPSLERSRVRDGSVEIAQYMRAQFIREIERVAGKSVVVDEPTQDSVKLELAIVELTPTDVVRNVFGLVFGAFVPGGGFAAAGSSGTIAIEGRLVEAASGKQLLLFADREKGKIAPINLNDFTLFSNARDAIDDWARQVALVLFGGDLTSVADSAAITLLPI